MEDFHLEPLNVVIGPNGAGQSNLVEALSVLRAAPRDLLHPIRKGGRCVRDWLWKCDPTSSLSDTLKDSESARIEVVFAEGSIAKGPRDPAEAVRYWLQFRAQGDSFVVVDERLENADTISQGKGPFFYYGYEKGRPLLKVRGRGHREIRRETLDMTQSVLSQRRDPDEYPELSSISEALARIRIYRNWQFGPNAAYRWSCSTSVRTDYLSEDFHNLPARLAVLKRNPLIKHRLLELVRELASRFDDFEIVPEGGALTLYLTEGGVSFPAHRVSDGALRFLCLLAILVDPDPSPLIAIEEPELGLHPDIHPLLASLLLDASKRTQLIVTTHSEMLIDALTETPETVIVCDKVNGTTRLERLNREELKPWTEKYRLGELWIQGEIGGTRW